MINIALMYISVIVSALFVAWDFNNFILTQSIFSLIMCFVWAFIGYLNFNRLYLFYKNLPPKD